MHSDAKTFFLQTFRVFKSGRIIAKKLGLLCWIQDWKDSVFSLKCLVLKNILFPNLLNLTFCVRIFLLNKCNVIVIFIAWPTAKRF
jgi:hypothetical protein